MSVEVKWLAKLSGALTSIFLPTMVYLFLPKKSLLRVLRPFRQGLDPHHFV